MSMRVTTYYYYKCLVQDVKGNISEKAGDLPGNNALHAMKAIENMNKNTWGGTLYQVLLYHMNEATGEVQGEPVIMWNRMAGTVVGDWTADKQSLAPDWNPDDYESRSAAKDDPKTSHSVNLADLGHRVSLSEETFTTIIPKGV